MAIMPQNHVETNQLITSSPKNLMSPGEIRKQFLLDTLQAKAILLPIGISIAGLLHSLLYAPVLGGENAGFILALAGGVVGIGIILWRSVIHYRQGYLKKMRDLEAYMASENLAFAEYQMQEMQATLEQGFGELNSQEGLQILRGLEHEYREVQPVIKQGQEADLLSLSNLVSLVQETYLQGLNVLERALELERAIGWANQTQLDVDNKMLMQKVAALKNHPEGSESLEMIQEKIDSNQERLDMVVKLDRRIDELLHQASRCESTLFKTHVELAALKADASDASVASVIDTLQKTIERAKNVQAELKKYGY